MRYFVMGPFERLISLDEAQEAGLVFAVSDEDYADYERLSVAEREADAARSAARGALWDKRVELFGPRNGHVDLLADHRPAITVDSVNDPELQSYEYAGNGGKRRWWRRAS